VIAYFDASYNHPQGKTVNDPQVHTVAAYLARRDDWRKLRKEWRRVLDTYKVSFFHVKDFEYDRKVAISGRGKISSKSPYADWVPEKFGLFEKSLHKVINRKRSDGSPRIVARTSNVLVKDYKETLPDDLKNHPACRSYFILNVVNVINAISTWADGENYHEPIHYIFAGGDDDIGDLGRWFNSCFQHEVTIREYRLSKGFTPLSYSIQYMQKEPALQMVDCPAYELNRAVVEWAKKDFQPTPMIELRASLSSLCKIDHFGATLRRPELLQVYSDIRRNNKYLERTKSNGL
jgi:hypothetical protein